VTYRPIFRPGASQDIIEAYNWYEGERPGLGDGLQSAIDSALLLLAHNPEIRPVVHRDLRRVSLHRFPYSLYYRIDGEILDIVALLHHRRNPQIWQSRP
jgi:plasmid stabilization system protein ParE